MDAQVHGPQEGGHVTEKDIRDRMRWRPMITVATPKGKAARR